MNPILLFHAALLFFSASAPNAHAWGELGHRIVTEFGASAVPPKLLEACHTTVAQLTEHTNDPDRAWKTQRRDHPNEGRAHFFHVDLQPKNWRERTTAVDMKQGYLVYRLLSWINEAKDLRQKGKWDALSVRLYGLSHYTGDLVEPLHLHSDYDGEKAGVLGIHSQFETKMLNRFETELRLQVNRALTRMSNMPAWQNLSVSTLILDTAQQSHDRAGPLLNASKTALLAGNTKDITQMSLSAALKHIESKGWGMPQTYSASKAGKRGRAAQKPRFVKAALWRETGPIAIEQLALGAKLWTRVLEEICR